MPGGAAQGRNARAKNSMPSPLYQKGTELYAKGDLRGAQIMYLALLRKDPENRPARIAVKRIAMELRDAQDPPAIPAELSWLAEASEAIDDFLVEGVPRVINFDATLGDAFSRVGTMGAHRGRVDQLLAERRLALDQGR
ncbi:MAG: hypothetical protein WC881_10650, partial [Elusimicrobiota bacterium]